jgi:hypothetical protein
MIQPWALFPHLIAGPALSIMIGTAVTDYAAMTAFWTTSAILDCWIVGQNPGAFNPP